MCGPVNIQYPDLVGCLTDIKKELQQETHWFNLIHNLAHVIFVPLSTLLPLLLSLSNALNPHSLLIHFFYIFPHYVFCLPILVTSFSILLFPVLFFSVPCFSFPPQSERERERKKEREGERLQIESNQLLKGWRRARQPQRFSDVLVGSHMKRYSMLKFFWKDPAGTAKLLTTTETTHTCTQSHLRLI